MRTWLVPLLLSAGQSFAVSIWIEGEDATSQSMHRHSWYDSVTPEKLSGGEWLSNFANGSGRHGEAEYDVPIPEKGRYALWLRANPTKSSLSMKIAGGEWTAIDTAEGWTKRTNVAGDGKFDLRFLAWKKVTELDLDAGTTRIGFRFDSANSNHGAIDAFVLTTDLWQPDGISKPGTSSEETALDTDDDGTTWAFHYGGDTLRDGSPIDLRRLNEAFAGERGFITRSQNGSDFAHGDGSPARFWAVGSGAGGLDEGDVARNARFLAKLGVNMIRFHGSFSPKKKGARLTDVNRDSIEKCWRVVAAMKKEGIYTTISPFWANAGFCGAQSSWGLEGYGDGEDVWGLLFFNETLKAAYKGWMRELYTTPNPHTGVPLAQEPAVAMIQIQNEDSLFFFTLQGIKAPQKRILDGRFSEWLKDKYGSVAGAVAAWEGFTVKGDDPATNLAAVMGAWEMTQDWQGKRGARLRDQTQFLGELQRSFYEEMYDFYKNELGCKQLINASNWKTASEAKLGDLERWTYDACDVIAVNRYYNGGAHIGPDNGWRINPNDFFQGTSGTQKPTALPVALRQNSGKPMIITESTWVHPLEYQSEGPFLMMAYQSLTGIDAYYWFSHAGTEYNLEPYHSFSKVDGQYGLRKWGLPPAIETMFPATALAYRMGYIQEAEPVLVESRSIDDLWDRKVPLIVEGDSFDPNRDESFEEGKVAGTEVPPSAFLQGPVVVAFDKGGRSDTSKIPPMEGKRIASTTGQLVLDADLGLCTVNAPCAQGATGFLSQGGQLRLGSLIIESRNHYATVLAVSLDGQPLDSSKKVLIQSGTKMRPTGWKDEPATHEKLEGKRVVSTGEMPWRADVNLTTLLLKTESLSKATALDTAGFPRGDVPVERVGSAIKFEMPRDAVWVILEAD